MSTERYHKAAKDGYLEALKEATKKDLNTRDEDGMTPTLWAAFEGNVDALRLIVGRGGEPDKSDNYGNSALHFAAARGHMNCVTFLVNFGVNLWALDIDFHTPKDLAAINNKEEILRFLDVALAREEAKDKKKAKSLQEKAEKDAIKRAKEFEKLQKKASKAMEEEELKLAKQRVKMGVSTTNANGTVKSNSPSFLANLVKESKSTQSKGSSRSFSQIVSNSNSDKKESHGTIGGSIASKFRPIHHTGVSKKIQQKKSTSGQEPDFKVSEIENNGSRSVRSLSGLRRDSEIMYVPKNEIPIGRRGKIADLFEEESTPVTYTTVDVEKRDDEKNLACNSVSIFDRPGFGSVAFRNNISGTMGSFSSLGQSSNSNRDKRGIEEIKEELWERDEENSDEDEREKDPVELFLASAGVSSYSPMFIKEKIDIDALLLLTEDDLTKLGIPMGPRRKLLKCIIDRQEAIENPGQIYDSRL